MTQFRTLIQLYGGGATIIFFIFVSSQVYYVGKDIKFPQVFRGRQPYTFPKFPKSPILILLAVIARLAVQSSTSTQIHNAILFIDTSTIIDTRMLIF